MASFNFEPTLRPTVLLAAILSGFPVEGLRPTRAARCLTERLANPGRTIESPCASRSVIQLITAFKALSESTFDNFDFWLIAAINSFLFIIVPHGVVLVRQPCHLLKTRFLPFKDNACLGSRAMDLIKFYYALLRTD